MNSCALSIDIGTSSVRVMAFDEVGAPVPGVHSQKAYEPTLDPPGAFTLDPSVILDAALHCIDDAVHFVRLARMRITHVGTTCFWHSCCGLNVEGDAITPIYTWADRRPGPAAEAIRSEVDAAAFTQRTGAPIHPSFFPARMRWLSEDDPALFQSVDRWASMGELLLQTITGQRACPTGMASASGLYHQDDLKWDAEALSVAGLTKDRLGRLGDGELYTDMAPQFRERWPDLDGAAWASPIGDGAASNIGNSCVTSKRAAINFGTSSAIRTLWEGESRPAPAGLWRYRIDRDHPIMGAAFSDAGSLTAWMRETLRLPYGAELTAQLRPLKPGQHGLTLLPFWGGERSYGWRPDARGTIQGLSLSTTALDIYQACLEAVALRLRRALEALDGVFGGVEEIVASGGALEGDSPWAQTLADALNRPIHVADVAEATSRGVAWYAMHPNLELAPPDPAARVFEPNPEHVGIYDELFGRQEGLYGLGL